MFGEVTKKCERVMFGGSVKMGFAEGVLASPQSSEEAFAGG